MFRVSWRLQLGPVKTAAGRCELPLLSIARDALTRQADLRVIGANRKRGPPVTCCSAPVEPVCGHNRSGLQIIPPIGHLADDSAQAGAAT